VRLVFNRTLSQVQAGVEFAACPDSACSPGVQLALSTNQQLQTTHCLNDTVAYDLSWVRFPENAILHWGPSGTFTSGSEMLLLHPDAGVQLLTQSSLETYRTLDTGQTRCFDGGTGDISCVDSGQDGDFADTPSPRRFELVDGGAQQLIAEPDTGLLWTRCLDGALACAGGETRRPWSQVLDACSHLNTDGLAGRADWRLPTRRELERLVMPGSSTPWDPLLVPGVMSDANHATATTQATNHVNAWSLNNLGRAGASPVADNSLLSVRCVSSFNATPLPQSLAAAGQEDVVDAVSGLGWTRCLEGTSPDTSQCTGTELQLSWGDALAQCSNKARYNWRLPNANELASLLALSRQDAPAWDALFPPASAALVWSSTTDLSSAGALAVNFSTGTMVAVPTSQTLSVRCVRTLP
jgi:hypothetical protein